MPTRWPTGCARDPATPQAREGWPTQGNEVFAVLPRTDADRLRKAGAVFHDWAPPHGSGAGSRRTRSWCGSSPPSPRGREDVDAFLAELGA